MQLHAHIGVELRGRHITRTSNNPIGDVAEYLFSQTFGWCLENNSKAGFDAISTEDSVPICPKNSKIQIKSRRVWQRSKSRQAGDIRNLDMRLFDYLAGVVFNEDYEIEMAILIPHALVQSNALSITHSNSSRIYLRDAWLETNGVKNLTEIVSEKWSELNSQG
jgi:hypothetical protein